MANAHPEPLSIQAIASYARILSGDVGVDSSVFSADAFGNILVTTPVSPALTDVQVYEEVNDVWMQWQNTLGNRLWHLSHTAAFAAGGSLAVDATVKAIFANRFTEVTNVFQQINASNTKQINELERHSPERMIQFVHDDATVSATCQRYSAEFQQEQKATSALKILLRFWPPSDGAAYFFSVMGRRDPFLLTTTDEKDYPYCTYLECLDIARIVGARIAKLIGRERSVIDSILAPVPENIRDTLAGVIPV